MLLPSDVARLVLGYLQQEGLSATSRAFIHESPNLREYAEHSTEDGDIPACPFSLFGKNLTTILNEYVAVKAKETCQENQIPAMMTSLWKKLDFTLNQIRSMQNSPAVHQIQRLRTHNSIQNMRRQQRPLSASSQSNVSVSTPVNCVATPIQPPQGMLGHSTPVCYTSQHTRPSTISLPQPGETTLQIVVPDHRFTPGPLSPARRKCDSPRRRGGIQVGSSRITAVSSTLIVEPQSQEVVTENLSMVIENAREKILSDRSLQEKLAENINKILASENSPQTSKAACSTVEQEQSIDEILGLQGEIHMTDDAIQDILEQTESDPAFQALFDLFDYGKSRTADDTEQPDGSVSNSAQESDETGHVDSAMDTGTEVEESTSGGQTTSRTARARNVQEAKSKRKSAVPLSAGKPVAAASQTSRSVTKRAAVLRATTDNRKGAVRSKVSLSSKKARGTSAATRGQSKKKAGTASSGQDRSSSSLSEEGASMMVDDLPSETSEAENPQKQRSFTEMDSQTNVQNSSKNASESNKQPDLPPNSGANASGPRSQPEKEMMVQISAQQAAGADATFDQIERSVHASSHNTPASSSVSGQEPTANKNSLLGTCPNEKESNSSSAVSVPSEITASVIPAVVSTPTTSSVCVSHTKSLEPDPSKIVALKIIISDEKEEQTSSDSALNQAVSSITGDRVPTIFLSSPFKTPTKAMPPPTSSITVEETAQAVNSLQVVEPPGTPVVCAQTAFQPSPARPLGQETSFIQFLPASTTFAGPSSYFVVTDPAATSDQHSSVMLLPGAQGPVSSAAHLAATPPHSRTVSMAANVSQAFSPASAIIISSPVQPLLQNMAVPVSVFGQNNTAKLVLPNQVVTLSGPTLLNQPAKIVPKPKLASKDHIELGKAGASGSSQVSKPEQLKSATGMSPSHRRILCFDENPNQTNMTSTSSTTAASVVKDHTSRERVQSCPSASTATKKSTEAVKLPEPSHNPGPKDLETASGQQQDTTQRTQTEIISNQPVIISSSSTDAPQPDESGRTKTPNSRTQPALNTENNPKASVDTAQSLKSSAQTSKRKTPREESVDKRLPNTPEDASTGNSPAITANKENEVEGGPQDSRQASAPSVEKSGSAPLRSPTPVSQGAPAKALSKTSPLTKQAVEMLQDIQSQSPTSTPPRRKNAVALDLPLPRTPGPGRVQEDFVDSLRTPLRHRHGRDADGTPRHLVPPTTPDIPSCSPASEAGSENSINMAAHTLMILSRAARTGGPLKDSLRQEEAGSGKASGSKGKKRKHTEASPTAKKELQLSSSSGSKKKSKKQKKLLDSFPHDLDVDKFLSSLHYDE